MNLDNECFELIKEIKKSVPNTSNLCSDVDQLEQFAYVQELIVKLTEFKLEEPFVSVIQTFKDFFHPILVSTISYETDFIKMVEPILRYPNLPLHAATVLEQQIGLTKAFSYHAVLNKLINPTEIEKKIGELLFLQSTNSAIGLKQTKALQIIFSN